MEGRKPGLLVRRDEYETTRRRTPDDESSLRAPRLGFTYWSDSWVSVKVGTVRKAFVIGSPYLRRGHWRLLDPSCRGCCPVPTSDRLDPSSVCLRGASGQQSEALRAALCIVMYKLGITNNVTVHIFCTLTKEVVRRNTHSIFLP
jgi:hypothetical protein